MSHFSFAGRIVTNNSWISSRGWHNTFFFMLSPVVTFTESSVINLNSKYCYTVRYKLLIVNIVSFFRFIRFENYYKSIVPANQLKSFFTFNINHKIITECNFNNCFWISAVVLENFLKLCINMNTLKVMETKITLAHITHIFVSCEKINYLSFTLSKGECKPVSILKNCTDRLLNLMKLEIVLFNSLALEDMAIFLRYNIFLLFK